MMAVHDLKIWPIYFGPVENGTKKFELRKADRDYKVGDILRLREFDPFEIGYTGQSVDVPVTYILDGLMAKELPGMCLMSIEVI